MMSMKGRFLKKLKFVPSISTLKQGLVCQLNSTTGKLFNQINLHVPSAYIKEDHKTNNNFPVAAGKTDESQQLIEELELDVCDAIMNITPPVPVVSNDKLPAVMDIAETTPVLLSSGITMEHGADEENHKQKNIPLSLADFEERCPPGGSELIILYTTSMRSIRKTFEDCHSIRFLLESFKVMFCERDVSLHMEFREELWRTLGSKEIPPRLFVRGRYIGGADEVISLHEQGMLKKLLDGMPLTLSTCPCTGCGNVRFVVCSNCNGSLKVFADEDKTETYTRCPECNENGLVKCPICK